MKTTVCVIGLGYIGLPTAALLAREGHKVTGVDIDPRVVSLVNAGQGHINEPELAPLLKAVVDDGRLIATDTPVASDVYFICVPTPFISAAGSVPTPDISYVLAAADNLSGLLKAGDVVILESTVPVGTTQAVAGLWLSKGVDTSQIHIAYCPERVLPGKILAELIGNDRIVGGLTPIATRKVQEFYRSFVTGQVWATDCKTAELCKLAENSYRDVNIAFANELSIICAGASIDVWEVIRLANRHPRVNILSPGVGVGGHCIAVDPWFIVSQDAENAKLIRTAREVNDYKPAWVVGRIKDYVGRELRLRASLPIKIACLGLSFKPDVDDLRESPAVKVAELLQDSGFEVVAVEPNVSTHAKFEVVSLEAAQDMADLLVVLVGHRQFLSTEVKARLMSGRVLDFCGLFAL